MNYAVTDRSSPPFNEGFIMTKGEHKNVTVVVVDENICDEGYNKFASQT